MDSNAEKNASLESLRHKIDDIDKKIVDLFLERLKISEEIGRLKREGDIPVTDEKREDEIIRNLTAALGCDDAKRIEKLYSTVFEISKSVQ